MDKSRRGRRRRVAREQFIEAGQRVARRLAVQRRELSDVLGVRQPDVLAEAGAILKEAGEDGTAGTPTAPLLYRQWPNYHDYLADVFASLFAPSKLDLTHLRSGGRDWKRNLRGHLENDMHQMKADSSLYFASFAAVADRDVRELLRGVYLAYDDDVVPALMQLLKDGGRTLSVPGVSDQSEAFASVAVLLTAVTEGLELRRLAQPDAVEPRVETLREMLVVLVAVLSRPDPAIAERAIEP
jgi:hypothetical protein